MAAPDFYFAINATFRWVHADWGEAGLRAYWQALGREHYADVTRRFQAEGLEGVAAYWQDFFADEPGAEFTVAAEADRVLLDVRVCPAIRHLREHGREIMPLYCRHCMEVSQAMGEAAGIEVQVEGGGGACRQSFTLTEGARS
jgi:hypothetical protein